MPSLVATQTGFPPHYYEQDELIEALLQMWEGQIFNPDRLRAFHKNVTVGGRHLAVERHRYAGLKGFGARNQAWIEAALPLGEKVLGGLLESAGLEAGDVSLLAFTTVTGLAVPSMEARWMNRLAFGPDTKRLPLFGLGCLAGAAGVSRVHDYLRAYPEQAAILIALELCSLTLQPGDLSVANLVASGLFGDGAAAVLMVGDRHPLAGRGPRVLDTVSSFFADTERVMGWDFVDDGFKVVLSPEVPKIAAGPVAGALKDYLDGAGWEISEVDHWVTHPGGPKVLDALEEALGLGPEALQVSRDSLVSIGNLSSASVLFILDQLLKSGRPQSGDRGVMMAMGPAFCAEAVRLQWD